MVTNEPCNSTRVVLHDSSKGKTAMGDWCRYSHLFLRSDLNGFSAGLLNQTAANGNPPAATPSPRGLSGWADATEQTHPTLLSCRPDTRVCWPWPPSPPPCAMPLAFVTIREAGRHFLSLFNKCRGVLNPGSLALAERSQIWWTVYTAGLNSALIVLGR